MRNLLRAAGTILALAALTVALVFVFVTMGRTPGQPAAQAPTPTPQPAPPILTNVIIIPTVSPTPRPLSPVIVDPTFPPPAPPTQEPPRPTPTPLPATGGPYISEAQAIAIARRDAVASGTVNEAVPPKAIFTPAKNVPSVIGKSTRGTESEREKWVVFHEGRFPLPRAPMPPPKKYSTANIG